MIQMIRVGDRVINLANVVYVDLVPFPDDEEDKSLVMVLVTHESNGEDQDESKDAPRLRSRGRAIPPATRDKKPSSMPQLHSEMLWFDDDEADRLRRFFENASFITEV